MGELLEKYSKVKVVYYSGTGGTARVAKQFAVTLRAKGYEASTQSLRVDTAICNDSHDLLVMVFAVHAANAPEAVYHWIENADKVEGVPAVVISVSGGGEVIPNTACRLSCIKKLEKKGYNIVYEEMFVMPSNWIVPTKESLALKLLEILPKRVEKTVENILSGTQRRTKPLFIDRLFSRIGELEKVGAKLFGKLIKVTGNCSSCGWCANNCPAGNIDMNMGRPIFGNKCHLCLGCIYGCPNRALEPGVGKFVVIKEGYRLEELEKKLPYHELVNVEALTKGYLWSGVRKYLLEQENYKNC